MKQWRRILQDRTFHNTATHETYVIQLCFIHTNEGRMLAINYYFILQVLNEMDINARILHNGTGG